MRSRKIGRASEDFYARTCSIGIGCPICPGLVKVHSYHSGLHISEILICLIYLAFALNQLNGLIKSTLASDIQDDFPGLPLDAERKLNVTYIRR